MEIVIILAVVGIGYLLLKQQTGTALSTSTGAPTQAAVSATVASNASQAGLQLQGINMTEAQPGSSSLEAPAIASGANYAGQAILQSSAGSSDSDNASAAAQGVAAGLGIIGSIAGSLLAAHTARVKGATAENSGINAIVPAFDADVREINAAWLGKSINAAMAVTYLQTVHDQYWAYMQQFVGRPGVATKACPAGQVGGPMGKGGCTSGQPVCDKTCTAGCCVGCSAINGSLANCIWAIQTGYHGPVAICAVFGSKFGANDRAGYQLSW